MSMSDAEWLQRVELAAAYRIASLEGADDGIFNHFSCAVSDDPGCFLIKPFGMLFSEVTASGLLKVDAQGKVVEGSGKWEPTAFFIHSSIYARVPRATCVFHTHMPYATALSSLYDMRILPVNQSSLRFVNRTSYLRRYNGLVLDSNSAEDIVGALCERDVLLMGNHGVTLVDDSVIGCVYDLHYLEQACRDQHLVLASGQPLRLIPDDVVERTAAQMLDEKRMAKRAHFDAMCRHLDAVNPGYAR